MHIRFFLSVNCYFWLFAFYGIFSLRPRSGEELLTVEIVNDCYYNGKGWFYGFSAQWLFHRAYTRWKNYDFNCLVMLPNGNIGGIFNTCVYCKGRLSSIFRKIS